MTTSNSALNLTARLTTIITILTLKFYPAMAQQYPDSYYQIPERLRSQATFVFAANYSTARGRSEIQFDGLGSAWYPVGRLALTNDYVGNLKVNLIEVEPLDVHQLNGQELLRGGSYLILLKPSEKNTAILEGRDLDYLMLDFEDEILAIVELSTTD